MRPPVVLVKLGGSLNTEKYREETARPEVIARVRWGESPAELLSGPEHAPAARRR